MHKSFVVKFIFGVLVLATMHAGAVDLTIVTESYIESGLYASQVLPVEGTEVTIGIEARIEGALEAPLEAEIEFLGARGVVIAQERTALTVDGNRARGEVVWTPRLNGMYRVRVTLDPDNSIAEFDAKAAEEESKLNGEEAGKEAGEEAGEANNMAELVLPVIAKDRALFFPWYGASKWVRWANVATSVKAETAAPLAARGIKALGWEYGGFSWNYFDDNRLETDREAALKELDALF
jgi:hypothetical protein